MLSCEQSKNCEQQQNGDKVAFLSCKDLDNIPQSLSLQTNLTVLDVSFNNIKSLPTDFINLKSLVLLNISGNNFDSVPQVICSFTILEQLHMCRNQLTTFSFQSLSNLARLKRLDISYNKIADIDKQIPQMKSLVHLNVAYNSLITVPSQIRNLKALVWLSFSFNKITTLNSQVAQLRNLETLDLSHNLLGEIAEGTFEHLHKLRKLYLDYNPITILPDLSDLICLDMLEITGTLITQVPTSLAKLEQLQSLGVGNMELQTIKLLATQPGIEVGQKLFIGSKDVSGKSLSEIKIMLRLQQNECCK